MKYKIQEKFSMPTPFIFFYGNKRYFVSYALPVFLSLALWSGPVPAANQNACEHANSHANITCRVPPSSSVVASIPEPAAIPLVSAGLLIWFGLTRRKNR
ncbi:MAG: PEP-CTERM sorting domain-containing protein [Gammaproteobacteria bacterium]